MGNFNTRALIKKHIFTCKNLSAFFWKKESLAKKTNRGSIWPLTSPKASLGYNRCPDKKPGKENQYGDDHHTDESTPTPCEILKMFHVEHF